MAVLGATGGASSSPTKRERDSAVLEGLVRIGSNPSGSRPNFFGRQHLTFDKGRAWMPEVERPEFRKDAKPTERSYGKSVCAGRGVVVLLQWLWGMAVLGATGGASSSPTKSEVDSAVLGGLVRSEGLLSFCNGCGGWQY